MAKTSIAEWALPVALIAIWAITREVKEGLDVIPDYDPSPTELAVYLAQIERTEELQAYEATRIADAQRIEAERAAVQLEVGNYGTVSGNEGAFTGTWFGTADPNKCHMIHSTPYASNATKFFLGQYCRDARTAGLIQ